MPGRRRRYVRRRHVSWPCAEDVDRVARNASTLACTALRHIQWRARCRRVVRARMWVSWAARLARHATLRSIRRPTTTGRAEENPSRGESFRRIDKYIRARSAEKSKMVSRTRVARARVIGPSSVPRVSPSVFAWMTNVAACQIQRGPVTLERLRGNPRVKDAALHVRNLL